MRSPDRAPRPHRFIIIGAGFAGLGMAIALRFDMVNIPHARYWLAPPRRGATVRSLHAHIAWLLAGTTAFLCWIFWQVAAANQAPRAAPALDSHRVLAGLAVVLAATAGWLVSITRRFRR